MIHGLDTGFLVAAEVLEHAQHVAARVALTRLLAAGDQIAIAPQVLAEFIHIVTDLRRFTKPLGMTVARQLAEEWWTAQEVVRVFPDDAATRQFLAWLQQFSLGRKRLLDTLLAATYGQAGIQSLLTTNPADFAVLGVFTCITPAPTGLRDHCGNFELCNLRACANSAGIITSQSNRTNKVSWRCPPFVMSDRIPAWGREPHKCPGCAASPARFPHDGSSNTEWRLQFLRAAIEAGPVGCP